MLTSPTHLRDELLRLDGDIGLLRGRRVALLGFRDPNPARVADNLRAVRETPGWTLVESGGPGGVPLATALAGALEAPHLALLLDVGTAVPFDADRLVRALHDSHDAVTWSDRSTSALPGGRKLYVVASGARQAGELPPVLQRIDFKTFIRPPG